MNERHKREEIFSFILVSNMDNQSRQFSISASGLKVLITISVFICFIIAGVFYLFITSTAREHQLRLRIKQEQENLLLLKQNHEEHTLSIEALERENTRLTGEIEKLRNKQIEDQLKAQETPKSALPRLYPIDGEAALQSTFSSNSPYLTILIPKGKI